MIELPGKTHLLTVNLVYVLIFKSYIFKTLRYVWKRRGINQNRDFENELRGKTKNMFLQLCVTILFSSKCT